MIRQPTAAEHGDAAAWYRRPADQRFGGCPDAEARQERCESRLEGALTKEGFRDTTAAARGVGRQARTVRPESLSWSGLAEGRAGRSARYLGTNGLILIALSGFRELATCLNSPRYSGGDTSVPKPDGLFGTWGGVPHRQSLIDTGPPGAYILREKGGIGGR